MALHPFSAMLFAAGYALREYGAFNYLYDAQNVTILIIYIISVCLIYVAP